LFRLPSQGLALKAGAHLAGGEALFGPSLEPGLSYFWGKKRFELGASVQFAWFYEVGLFDSDYEVRNFLILPRWSGSVGLDQDGFWRLHLSAGYGVMRLRSEVDYGVPSHLDRAFWTYGIGAGASAGVFHIEVQYVGDMSVSASTLIAAPGGDVALPASRVTGGIAVSVGLVFPIPLSGSE